jgi:hypothetical protein
MGQAVLGQELFAPRSLVERVEAEAVSDRGCVRRDWQFDRYPRGGDSGPVRARGISDVSRCEAPQ